MLRGILRHMQILFLIILILAVVIHEVAHGYAALLLGDETAKNEGRLTLNPIPHIDLFGTIILPALLVLTGSGILFGWAKPVPYNPYNLKGRYSEAIVAFSGPLSNIGTAVVAGLAYRLGFSILPGPLLEVLIIITIVSLFLGLFNLIPVPPLDGSKIVLSLLPVHMRTKLEDRFRSLTGGQNILVLIITLALLAFFVLDYIAAAVGVLTTLLTGMGGLF